MCVFIVKCKKNDKDWVEFSEEYDFSEFCQVDKRGKEFPLEIKFKTNP